MGYRHIDWDDEWIIKNYLNYESYQKMLEDYNKLHDTDAKIGGIKNHARMVLGISKPRKRCRHYTEEQIEWLKNTYPKYGCRKTAEMFNEKFHENRTMRGMQNFGTAYGIQVDPKVRIKNRTGLDHGKRAVREAGSLRWECGRLVMKMPDGRWQQVGRAVYEQKIGQIPKGWSVIHLDGDVSNYEENNLAAVPIKIHGMLQGNGLRSENAEITKTGIEWCKLKAALEAAGYKVTDITQKEEHRKQKVL